MALIEILVGAGLIVLIVAAFKIGYKFGQLNELNKKEKP